MRPACASHVCTALGCRAALQWGGCVPAASRLREMIGPAMISRRVVTLVCGHALALVFFILFMSLYI